MEANELTPTIPWLQCLKNNRMLTILLGFSVVAVTVEAIVIASLFPLKTIQLEIVEFQSSTNNFVKVAAAGEDISINQLVTSMFLRRFVVDREKIDKVTEQDRYARVIAMSTDELGADFQTVYGGQKALYYKQGFKRDIEITRDASLGYGIHQIEFKTFDTYDNKPSDKVLDNNRKATGEWVANLSYTMVDHEVNLDDLYLNPQGIVIDQYSLSRRKTE